MQHLLGHRRVSSEEQVKDMGLTLDFDEMARKGGMSKEEGLIAKWYGIYASRQPGDHMARIIIPGGVTSSAHAKSIAKLSDVYSCGKVSVTTRQTVQYHKLQLKGLAGMLRDLKKHGLTTFHGCGDVTRNVAACPWSSICQYRRFDVLPYAKKVSDVLSECRDLDNLPRKFKINFSGCNAGCGQPYVNCIGANAVVRKAADGSDEFGFKVVIGGGMGWKGFVAQELYSFVPAVSIVKVSRAIAILFRDNGDRFIRKYARLKFVVDRLGIEKCRELLEEIYRNESVDSSSFEVVEVEDCGGDIPSRPLRDNNPVDDDGNVIQRIMIPKGELSSADYYRIAELSEIYGDKYLYNSNRQNIEIHGVKPAKVDELRAEIGKLGYQTEGFYGLQDVVSCVGLTYCPLAVTRTHDMFDWFQEIVHEDKYKSIREKVLVNITGCPNSCGQHYLADIGLRGRRIREVQGSVEGYQIRIGGTQQQFGEIIGDFTFEHSKVVLEMVLDTFADICSNEQYDSLAEYVRKNGVSVFTDKIAQMDLTFEQAVNPLEYSQQLGFVSEVQDFSVIGKDIPCQNGCPAKTDIPEYIRLIKEGKIEEAHLVNQQDNVLPGVLGRICTHPCEDKCRHNWTNTRGPVRICYLKRSAADGKAGVSKVLPPYFTDKTGKKAAIIGAGPAGLAAARELVRYGHEVTIFEREKYPGGQVRMGVPEFRLPHDILNEDINAILDSGVKVEYNSAVSREGIDNLCGKYDVVLAATGANRPRSISLDGLDDGAAVEGLSFMKCYNDGDDVSVGENVVIIGGGFTAVDCTRSARRVNPNANITIMYRRGLGQMAATDEEMVELGNEKVSIQTLVTPVKAVMAGGKLSGVVFSRNLLGEPDESGKPSFTPIADSDFEVSCDTLIFAIGQMAEKELIDGIEITGKHTTSIKNLYVAGDFSMGNGDVISAVADGKMAADHIDTFLMGRKRHKKGVEIVEAESTGRLRDYDLIDSTEMPTIGCEQRCGKEQVELGYTAEQREDHSRRCYYCNYKFEIDQDKCIHCDWCIKVSPRDCISRLSELKYDDFGNVESFTEVPASQAEDATYIWINSDNCIRCGNCYNICPTGAISLRKADRGRQLLD